MEKNKRATVEVRVNDNVVDIYSPPRKSTRKSTRKSIFPKRHVSFGSEDIPRPITMVHLRRQDMCPEPCTSSNILDISEETHMQSIAEENFAVVPKPAPFVKQLSAMQEEILSDNLRRTQLAEFAELLQHITEEGGIIHREHFLKSLQNREFLQRAFQLFDHDRDNRLKQEEWIEFLKTRLLDEKGQIDLAEVIESVAYAVCGENDITFDNFCQIFQTKGVLSKLFRLVDDDQDGVVTANQVMELLATLTTARPRIGLTKEKVEWLEQLFKQTVGDHKEIKQDDFKKIVHSKNPFFTDRVFQIFDRDNSGTISLHEFIDAMHQFAGQSPDDKIRFLFKVYDLDGDGLIQVDELKHVMRACMEENGMMFSDEQISDLTSALCEDADPDTGEVGALTFEALKAQLEKHEGLLQNLSISIERWLVPPKPKKDESSLFSRLKRLKPYQLSIPYFKNNYVYLCFLFVYLFVNAGLFVSRAIEFSDSNVYTIIARACGQCLNFNCVFILVLMLRQCITFLRTHGFSSFLPLDHHIYLHKLTGWVILILSLSHTTTHLINFAINIVPSPELNPDNYTYAQWILTSEPHQYGLIPGVANPTGVALIIIILVMVICSQPFVRRGGCFEIFYFTHLMFIPFWILLIIHGPHFWEWFVVPGIVFVIECIVRFSKLRTGHGKTYISSAVLLPSKVTHLVIKKPQYFDFHPGDYVFVKIPAIATYEWHPFTISSCPEQEDAIWLHIRAVGEWTNRLYTQFEKELQMQHYDNNTLRSAMCSKLLERDTLNDASRLKKLRASISSKLNGARTPSRRKMPNKMQSIQAKSNGISNESFVIEDSKGSMATLISNGSSANDSINDKSLTTSGETSASNALTDKPAMEWNSSKGRYIFSSRKKPLSKSVSLPDVQNRMKKRERLLEMRNLTRSESEKNFDELLLRKSKLNTRIWTGSVMSPSNKSVVKSFRYMRHKPTIIELKTPSFESRMESRAESGINSSLEGAMEEGTIEDAAMRDRAKAEEMTIGKPLEIYIDGPYGAPSSRMFRSSHAVLIATGIGVTPFASILQSIMQRYWKARHTCPRCSLIWAGEIPHTVMNLKKVDFFWINRDQRSFEWFVNLLSQLEIEQAELGQTMERFLDMHMYITSALQKTDMKAVGLQLAMDLLHEKEKRDLITGLKTRTIAGRPNWNKVFQQLRDQKKGKITVFYCGPPELGRTLRVKCLDFGFSFRKEIF